MHDVSDCQPSVIPTSDRRERYGGIPNLARDEIGGQEAVKEWFLLLRTAMDGPASVVVTQRQGQPADGREPLNTCHSDQRPKGAAGGIPTRARRIRLPALCHSDQRP